MIDLDIDTDSIAQELKYTVENFSESFKGILDKAVTQKVNSLLSDPIALVKMIEDSPAFREAIYKYFDKRVATEVGNRLRCGIYDGTKVDDLFEKVWTPELDKAMEDRIIRRLDNKINDMIKTKLAKISSGI